MTESLPLLCAYCTGPLMVNQRTEGGAYMSYDVTDSIECQKCDAEWEPDGTPRHPAKWIRYPDLYER